MDTEWRSRGRNRCHHGTRLMAQKNLQTLRIAKLAQERTAQIHNAMVPGLAKTLHPVKPTVRTNFIKSAAPQNASAQRAWRTVPFVEMGEEATIDHLMQELQVQERLDAVIDRCIKRLLMVRGLKSMSIGRASAPLQGIPEPPSAA